MSTSSLDDVDTVSGDGEQMVIKTQPELPKYAQQPMPIGEKINLKFEVSCGRPLIYEWLKQELRELQFQVLAFTNLTLGQLKKKKNQYVRQ